VNIVRAAAFCLVACVLVTAAPAAAPVVYRGRVINASTRSPVEGAFVTLRDSVVRTDVDGGFQIIGHADRIGVRAHGYMRAFVTTKDLSDGAVDVPLAPLTPKALYLSVFGIGNTRLRQAALDLLDATEMNGLVIDVKGDRGLISYKSAIPLAAQIGAQTTITIPDLSGLLASLHDKGFYTIARIVTFKDNPLALARPDLAVKTHGGALWRDRERLAWTDPFAKEVWEYNLAIAEEAARSGFDEIQFDYARFPDANGVVFSQISTESSRVKAIAGFFQEARSRLRRYNVFLAADIFGYVCWNLNDTGIGQKLEELAPHLDVISPMLYPSGYHLGIPGYRNPVAHPYEIVQLSLRRAQERTGLPATRFRPWLQAFTDYAFDRRPFTGTEIRAQIDAAEQSGSNGWMLWNPRNTYGSDGLRPER
jgi:hypothetical protein